MLSTLFGFGVCVEHCYSERMACLYTSAFDYVYVYISVWTSGQARKSGSASYTLK